MNNCNVFTHSNFVLNHRWLLTDFVRVEKLVVILLLRTSQKFSRHVADFEQFEKLVLLTLDRLSCFSDGCFLNYCFLDDCFLNGCLLLWTIKKLNNYFVDFEQIKKKKKFSLSRIYLHTLSKYLLTCTHPFPLVFLICQNLFSSVHVCLNIKTSKVLIFLFVKNIVTWIIFDWIMKTKCFMGASQYFS